MKVVLVYASFLFKSPVKTIYKKSIELFALEQTTSPHNLMPLWTKAAKNTTKIGKKTQLIMKSHSSMRYCHAEAALVSIYLFHQMTNASFTRPDTMSAHKALIHPEIAEKISHLLLQVRITLEDAVSQATKQCSENGRLHSAHLDRHQSVSYEIAWASAELLAAENMYASINPELKLEFCLAIVFAADTIVGTLSRLEKIFIDLDMDLRPLYRIAESDELLMVRKQVLSSNVRAQIGAAAISAPESIGQVALDADVVMAQDAFRRFAHDHVAPQAEKIHRNDLTVPDDILDGMRAMGAFGLSIPENYGGSASGAGNDLPIMVAVTETLSEASLAAAGSLLTRPEILARALLEGGTEEQKTHWLHKIASGELLCAIAITEPDYGSDVARLSLKASKTEGGWLLNGAKTWCTFAGKADLLMVVARTEARPGYQGLSLLLVEKPTYDGHEFTFQQESGGQLTGRAIPTIGYRGMHSFDVHFENFYVPGDRLIGAAQGQGNGFYYTMAGMTGGRIQTAARAAGVMRAALLTAIEYAKNRQVFGNALAELQLTQVRICTMAALYAACRKLTYAVSSRLEAGGNPMEASLVKLIACRAAENITRDAQQLHGGMGYAEESSVSRHFVDARVLSIFEGAEETLALKVISRNLFESALLVDSKS